MNKGFTLLEVVIYLALLSIIMGSALVAAFGIIDSRNILAKTASKNADLIFLLEKISLFGTNISSIQSPAPGATSSEALLVYHDRSEDSAALKLENSALYLLPDTGSRSKISGELKINAFSVYRIPAHDSYPEALVASFDVDGIEYQNTFYVWQ